MEKEARYTAILKDNRDRIYRMCCCYVQDDEARKDVFQQALIHVWQNLDSFEGRAQVSTWICRIAINTCLGFLKSEQRRKRLFLSSSESPDERMLSQQADQQSDEREEEIGLLYECLGELPSLDRTLMSLYLEDLSTKEMADVLDISEANVRVKIHRIKKSLKEAMERKSHGLG